MTKQETIEELERLARIYYERQAEFAKASRIRWLLSFVGFVLVFFYLLILGDIKSLFRVRSFEEIKNILMMLLVCIMFTGFYYFINVSVFGWLFQKDIAEDRRLDDIEKRIRELEKTLN